MIPISAKYAAALRAGASIRVTAYADLYLSPTGAPAYRCVVEDGSVSADRSAAVRRTCSLTLQPDAAILPARMADMLAPNGAEIRPFFGVVYADGSKEMFPMGVFQITQSQITDSSADLQLVIQGQDRSYAIGARKLLVPYTISAGTNVASAILSLATRDWVGLPASLGPTDATTSETDLREGADPWAEIVDLGTAGAYEAFFDLSGTLVGRPVPDPRSQPAAWGFAEGDGLIKQLTHTLDSSGISNHFIVHTTSADVDPPVRGEATDQYPGSPTNIDSVFGDRPTFIGTDFVQTAADAQLAAANALQASLGASDVLTIDTVPMPCFDVDDVVTMIRRRIGLSGDWFVVDRVTHSLRGDGATQLTTRRVWR